MLGRNSTLFLLIVIQTLLLIHSSVIPPRVPFNLSQFLFPKVTSIAEWQLVPPPSHFLQNVVDAIVDKEKWALEDIRVSELNVRKAKYEPVRKYEFRMRVGKNEVFLKMYERSAEWKKLTVIKKNGTSNFESLVKKIESEALIDSFKIEGPFELQVIGDDDQLSITLPLNSSYSGLRRILVGEGITLEVKGAEEISVVHPSNLHRLPYDTFPFRKMNEFQTIWLDSCATLPAVRILGSASVVAYSKQRPSARIKTVFSSEDVLKLFPDKCYSWENYVKEWHLFSDLSIKIHFLEGVLKSLVHVKVDPNPPLGSVKARIRASTIFRFHLELERDIRSNDTVWSTLAEWRTRPAMERVLFDVSARMEGEALKPISIKKIRPFAENTDSFAWNTLLSNISFTKFPSMLVPPEALTLDVKW